MSHYPETLGEPTYLRQGSCLMVFGSPEAATQAHAACVAAFNGNLQFAGFQLRPPLNPLPDWARNGQPCQPWLVLEHRCIIFGIAALASNSAHFPGDLEEFFILNDPPIVVGNHVRNFGLYTPRVQQVRFEEAPTHAHADNLVILPRVRAVA
ncbi:MAG: hypothetical protein M1400_00280 [Patescibacteria group bacterium]|nr:hypothetical protein [Patescibacteria group bacterium]